MNERYKDKLRNILIESEIDHVIVTYEKLSNLVAEAFNDGYLERIHECEKNQKGVDEFLKEMGTRDSRKT